MHKLTEAFGAWLQSAAGPEASAATTQRYQRYAEKFMAEYGHPREATEHTLKRWQEGIQIVTKSDGTTKPVAASTFNLKVTAIRQFFAFCAERGITKLDAARVLARKRKEKRLPRYVPETQILKLFEEIEKNPNLPEKLQDRAIVEVLFGSGLRRSEAATLKLDNVENRFTLRVLGKGNKERQAPIVEPEYEAIRTWVLHQHGDLRAHRIRREIDADAAFTDLRNRLPHLPIFVAPSGKPLTAYADPGRYVWARVTHYAREAGLGNIVPHQLRHSYATYLLNNGADILLVGESMGHASLDQTRDYVKVLDKGLHALRHAHPRAA